MTTYQQCRECREVVPWAPPPFSAEGEGRLVPWVCEGGNALERCPRREPPKLDGGA